MQSPARCGSVSIRIGGALALVAVVFGSTASAAVSLQDMAGYWTGTGKVIMTNGNSENVKCVVIYKVATAGFKQTIRCASQGFSFNGTAEVDVAQSGSVKGNWTENTYSANGDVTGKTTDKGFSLAISGATFTAAMDVTTTTCKQTLDIVPQGLDVKRISLGLGKC
jgi:hypothetical protein